LLYVQYLKQVKMTNAINWFEIPVKDFDRAKSFYSTIMGGEITEVPMEDGMRYGVFPHDREKGVGGGIIAGNEQQNPSMGGVTVYLNGGEDLSAPLAKIEAAGGKIVMPKTAIGEDGFMAQFLDTEGNKLALHSLS
jgi:predicted enzyme related to lactoylglutathione lyase